MEPGLLRILYVDDDHNDLALFGIAAEQTELDIELFTALDGQQAIDYLEGRGNYGNRVLFPMPDVILLDMKMAFTGGMEFLEWRNKSKQKTPPVMLFSSDTRDDERQRALEMGADGYMDKPHGFSELKRAIHHLWNWAWEYRESTAKPGCGGPSSQNVRC